MRMRSATGCPGSISGTLKRPYEGVGMLTELADGRKIDPSAGQWEELPEKDHEADK